MDLIIKRNGQQQATAAIDESALFVHKLMGEHRITATSISALPLNIQIGDYIEHNSEKYYLNVPPSLEKINNFTYTQELIFEAEEYQLYNKLFMDEGQADFSYHGSPLELLQLLITNINNVQNGWALGTIDTAESQTLSFDGDTCRTALTKIAEAFGMEYRLAGKTIYMQYSVGTATTLQFEYGRGKGLYNLQRGNLDDKGIVTRVYGFGARKNIALDYRDGASRLVFEEKKLEKNTNIYGIREGSVTFDDVFPNRTSTVVETEDKNTINDPTINFDLNNQLIEGTTAKIVFKTGALSGYQFEIKRYLNNAKSIEFLDFVEENGYTLPNSLNKPAVGDEYTLVDIKMPQTYIDAAETLLESKTQAYLDENSVPRVSYDLHIDEKYVRDNGIALKVGDLVGVKDTALGLDSTIRVSEVSYPIVNVAALSVVISDTVPYTLTERLVADTIDNSILTKNVDRRRAELARRANARMRQLQDLTFDPDGYFSTDKIKPQSIETLMLSVGAKSQNFSLMGVTLQPNAGGNANNFIISGGQLVHYEISIDALGYVWTMDPITFTALDPLKNYYVYAKCSKTSLTGVWELSETSQQTEASAGNYLFNLGVLYNVVDGRRDFDFTNGMTFINGDTIKTGKIESLDGLSWFDLSAGKFKVGDNNSSIDWDVTTPNKLTIKGSILQTDQGTDINIANFRNNYISNTTYYKNDTVSYNGQVYISISNSPIVGKLPTDANFWSLYSASGDGVKTILTVASEANYLSPAFIRLKGNQYNYIGRGYTVMVLTPATEAFTNPVRYDTYGTPTTSTTLANFINNLSDGEIVIITSYDATSCNTDLRNALIGCGSSLNAVWTPFRKSHCFIGQKGAKVGTAYEKIGEGSTVESISKQEAIWTSSGLVLNGAGGNKINRNLVTNSGEFENLDGWLTNGSVISLETTEKFKGYNTIKVDGTANQGGIEHIPFALKSDTVYTFSVWIKSTNNVSGNNNVPLHIHCWTEENPANFQNKTLLDSDTSLVAGQWKQCWLNFKTPVSPSFCNLRIHLYTIGSGNVIYTSDYKVEEGYIPTDWLPAWEDLKGIEGPAGQDGSGIVIKGTRANSAAITALSGPHTQGDMYIAADTGNGWVWDGTTFTDIGLIRGPVGPQGVPGTAGANGEPTYTWIKYADSATGTGISNSPTGKSYIGFAYNRPTPIESNNANDYAWALIKGDQGDTGVPGADGADGQPRYTWIKYSNNADGAGLYDTPTANTTYIGISTNKTTASESSNKADYIWSKFKGADGADGADGQDGVDGQDGDVGPSIVFRGNHSNTATYYNNDTRRDVVKYNSVYYIFNHTNASTGSFNAAHWENFGAQFESVATNLLLAESANIADWIIKDGKISSQTEYSGDPVAQLDGVNGKIKFAGPAVINSSTGGSNVTVKAESTFNEKGLLIERPSGAGQNYGKVEVGIDHIYINSVRPLGGGHVFDTRRVAVEASINANSSRVLGGSDEYVTGFKGSVNNSSGNPTECYGGHFTGLYMTGPVVMETRRITSSLTITKNSKDYVIVCASGLTVTMPSLPVRGRTFIVKRATGSTVTINGNGNNLYHNGNEGNTINIGASGRAYRLVYDGIYWQIFVFS